MTESSYWVENVGAMVQPGKPLHPDKLQADLVTIQRQQTVPGADTATLMVAEAITKLTLAVMHSSAFLTDLAGQLAEIDATLHTVASKADRLQGIEDMISVVAHTIETKRINRD